MSFDPISAAMDLGGKLIDRLWPDPAQRDAAKLEMLKMQQTGELQRMTNDTELAKAQMAINAAEAASGNAYASSWRPTIGYICAIGLAYNFVGYPLATWYASVYHPGFVPPQLFDDKLMELVMGMLGLAGLRTFEKVRSAA